MNELEHLTPQALVNAGVSETPSQAVTDSTETTPHPVDPVRSAAGRLGGKRVHQLAELGREFEKEHGLTPGRQRRKQLVQLGKRYEIEHGLRAAKSRRRKGADEWQEFLSALARVVKPAHRPAVEQLAAALRLGPTRVAEEPQTAEQAA